MLTHRTAYRVIYGDTDKMGVAYYANHLRWFEIGRTELLRSWGVTYRQFEENGVFLPVSEVFCKYHASAYYDETLIIETSMDARLRAVARFDYSISAQDEERVLATGYTKHAFLDEKGRVVRPPKLLKDTIARVLESS